MTRVSVPLLALSIAACAYAQFKTVNPTVKKVVESVSEERIAGILKKLEGFETRNIFSEDDSPTRGIGAARRWIADQFKSYSPRLEVRFDSYKVKKKGRIVRDVEIHNVVAVLPGKLNPERQFIISGHYDSLALLRRNNAGGTNGDGTASPDAAAGPAPEGAPNNFDLSMLAKTEPGVTDDGSGTAAVMELARVMSQFEFEKTIVFIAFAGEEE